MVRQSLFSLVAILVSTAMFGCASDCRQPVQVEDFQDTIKVACIGDSITFGSGIPDRAKDSYPAQLGRMLGEKWEVKNFGVSGATLLKKGNKPYWIQGAFVSALGYKPDIVVIKLGTNDTKPDNWIHAQDFAINYAEMIESFRSINKDVLIWVCLPVPAYPERWGIRDSVIKEEVVPIVKQVAAQQRVNMIDLYTALSNRPELFPDKIHPNAEGAKLMAKEVYKALRGKEYSSVELDMRLRTGAVWRK